MICEKFEKQNILAHTKWLKIIIIHLLL